MITIETDPLYFDSLYRKARESYYNCVNIEGNEFLQEEINMPPDSLILTESNIKFVFSPRLPGYHTVEVRLELSSVDDNSIGYYDYIEDMEGEFIDNVLVFF